MKQIIATYIKSCYLQWQIENTVVKWVLIPKQKQDFNTRCCDFSWHKAGSPMDIPKAEKHKD